MRGSIAISIALAFFFGSAILYLLTCSFSDLPAYDVPPCTSESSCIKATGLHRRAVWYAQLVGRAWYYSNATMKLYDTVQEICSRGVDLSAVPELVAKTTSKLAGPAQRAVYFADQSVYRLVQGIAHIDGELHRSGVKYTPYSDVRHYHAVTSNFLMDLKMGTGRTPLSRAVLDYYTINVGLHRLLFSADMQMENIVKITSRYGSMLWPTIPFAFPLLVVGAEKVFRSRYSGRDVINASVGLGSSVFSAAAPVLNGYYAALERYDRKAEEILESSLQLKNEIYGLAARLETIGATGFTSELLSFLPGSTLREASIVQQPDRLPSEARIRAGALYRSVLGEVTKYRLRDDNYFLSLYTAEEKRREMQEIRDDLLKYLEEYESLVRGCYATVSKYKPRSSYVSNALRGYATLLKENPSIPACADALRLIALDNNYASNERILESCEREVSCGGVLPHDYPCTSGTVEERIACCLAYRERKSLDLKASDAYAHYSDLRLALESLLSYYDDPKIRAEYLELPTDFICESHLFDAVSRATKLYLQLRKNASKHVAPVMDVNGYLDSKNVSTIRLRFALDAGGADLVVDYELPFQVLAYRVVQSDGLAVTIAPDGRTAVLRGSGWAEVEAQVMPVPLDVEELGSGDGYVYLRIVNDKPLPIRHKISGSLISGSSNVRWEGGYVYFDGAGEAVVAVGAVEMNYVLEGNTLYVYVRNTGEHEYDGSVLIPYSGEDLPKKCKPFGDATLCSLRLKPFSEESIEIDGVFGGVDATLSFKEVLPPEFNGGSLPAFSAQVPAEQNAVKSMKKRVLEILSELESYYRRAKELNVTDFLPFSLDAVKDLRSRAKESDDLLVLNSIYATAQNAKSALISRAKASVFSIPESEDVRRLAEKALVNDDYVLALALASAYAPEDNHNASVDNKYLAALLGLASLAALVYFLRSTTPKKRKKIPKI